MNKHKRSKPPPVSIPRSGSLLYRLQQAPHMEDEALPYLDQLMIFLEDPPPGVRDRWKKGAKMCAAWGIPCSGPSVWRLYRSYAIEWRIRVAHEKETEVTESPVSMEERVAHLTALRTLEALVNPNTPTEYLLGLARIEFRKKLLAFAEVRHRASNRNQNERALDALAKQIEKRPKALAAFNQFQDFFEDDLSHLPPPYDEV